MTRKTATLVLDDGSMFHGFSFGFDKAVAGEVVFNTAMTGYPESLTDPSYAGQLMVLTYPLVGNYGVPPFSIEENGLPTFMESEKIHAEAIIVSDYSEEYSHWNAVESLGDWLKREKIPGITGIDTRALTKILREKGTMNGMITTNEAYDLNEVLPKLKEYTTGKVVEKVTCREKYVVAPTTELAQNGPLSGAARFDKEAYEKGVREPKPALVTELSGQGLKVALLDLGAKRNIARSLAERGCEVTVYPAGTPAQEIIDDNPDGIMLSNGPGDPKECTGVIAEIKKLYDTEIPIFAICLGHQLMALATGADTHKMKYGHRGGNHPVKDLMTGRVYISSQNHGYVVDTDKLDPSVAVPAFINVNDGTNEGLSYTGKNIFTVQFHPEACPGPQDSGYLFDRFIHMMRGEN